MMATTNSTNKPVQTYYIHYGFSHGPAHSRSFRRQIEQAGYIQAASSETADIIIAHSAGTWAIPKQTTAQLILLIGQPLQDGKRVKSFTKALRQSWQLNRKHTATFSSHVFFSLCYSLRYPNRQLTAIRRAASFHNPDDYLDQQVIYVINRHDVWPTSHHLSDIVAQRNYSFISLNGSHDELWYSPGIYIDIINHYARLLAQANN
jgi:hypothetical protein